MYKYMHLAVGGEVLIGFMSLKGVLILNKVKTLIEKKSMLEDIIPQLKLTGNRSRQEMPQYA